MLNAACVADSRCTTSSSKNTSKHQRKNPEQPDENIVAEKSGLLRMAENFEDQPWYREWRAALERVISTSMTRDRTVAGTPEREAANRECEFALEEFRRIANQVK